MKDVTIILQGLVAPKQLELWKKHYKNYNVIISCWEDEKFDFESGVFSSWLPKKWKIIKNQYPLVRFKSEANLDYQIITTLNALKVVDTKYVIKSRLDEFYSNVHLLLPPLKTNEEKIICGSVFFREYGLYPFHIADKLMCGTTDNLILMFESTLHNLEMKFWNYNIPESQLGLGYVMGKEINLDLDYWKKSLNSEYSNVLTDNQLLKTLRSLCERLISNSTDLLSSELFKKDLDWDNIENNLTNSIDALRIAKKGLVDSKYDKIDYSKYIKKYFDVVDVNKFKPYIVTRSNGGTDGGRKWWIDNFDNKEQECVTSLRNYGKVKKDKHN